MFGMPAGTQMIRAVALCFSALLPAAGYADDVKGSVSRGVSQGVNSGSNDKSEQGFDTEHLFGFMFGSDIGTVGEREFQSQTTGRFGKSGGTYRAISQEFELEFVPAPNFRVELGGAFASHDISGVWGFENRRQLALQGVSLDLRYRLLDREVAPFGLLFGVETHAERIDEATAAKVRQYGTEFTLAFDRELIPNMLLAALNLQYQPEWTHVVGSGTSEQDATIGVAASLMAQVRPGLFLGSEARYLRKYEGLGLNELAGQALFVGPTAFVKLSERSRLTAAWSFQAWGRAAGVAGPLNLIDFERHHARLIFGVNF